MAPHEVELFLMLVRQAYDDKRLSYRRGRQKNLDTLLGLGITPSQMYDVVIALKACDALGLPIGSSHPGYPDESKCEFGTQVEGREIYIKICVVGLTDGAGGAVISFHFPERPMYYPFK